MAAGGPNLTEPTDSRFQKATGRALASRFAHGDMATRYRSLGKPRPAGEVELILCNMAFRRTAYREIGGLDERLYPNEENELINRMTKRGMTMYYIPEAKVYRSRRKTWFDFIRQTAWYGKGRFEQTRVEGFSIKALSFMIPLVFSLYVILLPCLAALWPFEFRMLLFSPLLVYLCGAIISAAGISFRERDPHFFFLMPLLYLTMHVSYSCGLVRGLLRRIEPPEKSNSDTSVKIIPLD